RVLAKDGEVDSARHGAVTISPGAGDVTTGEVDGDRGGGDVVVAPDQHADVGLVLVRVTAVEIERIVDPAGRDAAVARVGERVGLGPPAVVVDAVEREASRDLVGVDIVDARVDELALAG